VNTIFFSVLSFSGVSWFVFCIRRARPLYMWLLIHGCLTALSQFFLTRRPPLMPRITTAALRCILLLQKAALLLPEHSSMPRLQLIFLMTGERLRCITPSSTTTTKLCVYCSLLLPTLERVAPRRKHEGATAEVLTVGAYPPDI